MAANDCVESGGGCSNAEYTGQPVRSQSVDPQERLASQERARQLRIRRHILSIAEGQLKGEVSVQYERYQVNDYVGRSGGPLPADFKTYSWCTDFVYWVLAQAKIDPLPDAWQRRSGQVGSNAVGRFFKRFGKTRYPQPGDLYYRPNILINGRVQSVQHVGFVAEAVHVLEANNHERWLVRTINGNGGGKKADWVTWPLGGGQVSDSDNTPLLGQGAPDPIIAFMPVLPMIVGRSVIRDAAVRARYPQQPRGHEQ
jgi:hypothetical protein